MDKPDQKGLGDQLVGKWWFWVGIAAIIVFVVAVVLAVTLLTLPTPSFQPASSSVSSLLGLSRSRRARRSTFGDLSSSYSSSSSSTSCDFPKPRVLSWKEGETTTFQGETIQWKVVSPDVDVTIDVFEPRYCGSPHYDAYTNLYFTVLRGRFTVRNLNCDGTVSCRKVSAGDELILEMQTRFQLINDTDQCGVIIGVFSPGNRIELFRELDRYEKLVGRCNVDPQVVSEILAKFGIFPW